LSSEFQENYSLVFIFSKNFDKVLLIEKEKKLDGITIKKNEEIESVQIAKKIFEDTNLKIDPSHLRLVLQLPNVNKSWVFNVYMSIAEIENVSNENYKLIDVKNIPNNCHPTLVWLLPLCIDISVYGSNFNQILMK